MLLSWVTLAIGYERGECSCSKPEPLIYVWRGLVGPGLTTLEVTRGRSKSFFSSFMFSCYLDPDGLLYLQLWLQFHEQLRGKRMGSWTATNQARLSYTSRRRARFLMINRRLYHDTRCIGQSGVANAGFHFLIKYSSSSDHLFAILNHHLTTIICSSIWRFSTLTTRNRVSGPKGALLSPPLRL